MENKKYFSREDTIPFEPIHPGEFLFDELNERGISQRKFAKTIECSYSSLNKMIKGKRSISALTACKIEAALGTNAQVWLDLQTYYDMQKARKDKKLSSLLAKIRNRAALL